MDNNKYIYAHKKIGEDLDEIFFTATNITYENETVYISGEVGYQHDNKTIHLIYNLADNEIIVNSDYRLLSERVAAEKYKHSYKITNSNPNGELIKIEADSIPYYRFPRTKDGISIPNLIHQIFKVYQDDNVKNKPQIIIPSELYVYYVVNE
jgi:hypothetical protein